MHACTAFFCLFRIPATRLSASGQSFKIGLPKVLGVIKIAKTIEALLLLLVFGVLLTTPGWATTYPVTDSFNGSGSLSSNWTNTTATGQPYVAVARNSGMVGLSVPGQQGLAIYSGATFANDQYAQATFINPSSASSDATGVCVHMSADGTGVCYLAAYGVIYALTNGVGSYGIGDCPIPSSGDTIQLKVVGSTYTCTDVTTGASASGNDVSYPGGNPGILIDQVQSTLFALTHFQADCSPSCSAFSGPSTISLGSFSTTVANPGFDNTATSYLPSSSMVNNGSTATYNISSETPWHSSLGSSSYVSYDPGTGVNGSVVPPNGDYFYTTTFTVGPNASPSSVLGTLTVLADDTVAVYLNGVQILNSAGPIGPDNNYYLCSDVLPNCVVPLTFDFTGIVNGQNVLTFDVKQVAGNSEGLDYVGTIALNVPAVTMAPSNVQLYASRHNSLLRV
jgi:hypothetical protein